MSSNHTASPGLPAAAPKRGGIISCLVAAARLDVFDLVFEWSSEPLNLLSTATSNLPRKGLLLRICIFLWHMLGNG